MKLVKVMLGGLMLAAAPLAALADDMSYSFVDLAYVETDVDGVESVTGRIRHCAARSGSRRTGSCSANTRLRASAALTSTRSSSASAGTSASPKTSTSSAASAGPKVEISSGPIDVDDDGYLVDAALRGRVGDAVELEGGVRYTDFSDGGDATSLFVGGRFHFNETWALGVEYQDGDDSSTILADVRVSF